MSVGVEGGTTLAGRVEDTPLVDPIVDLEAPLREDVDTRGVDPDALIEEARRRQRRRHIRVALLALAATLVAAGVAAWFATGGSSPLTVGVIRVREAVALRNADRLVVRVTMRASYGHSAGWADFARLQTRTIVDQSGQPPTDTAQRYIAQGGLVAGEATTNEVDYGSRVWTTYKVSHLPRFPYSSFPSKPRSALSETVPEALLATVGQSALAGPLAVLSTRSPYGYAALGGTPWVYRLVGRDNVNGQPAVELLARWSTSHLGSLVHHDALTRQAAQARFDVWVSSTTYLPVQEQQYDGTRLQWTVDFTWLPDTNANHALLNVNVPQGFTHKVEKCNTAAGACPE